MVLFKKKKGHYSIYNLSYTIAGFFSVKHSTPNMLN